MVNIPVIDPDGIAEVLCNGPFHLSFQGREAHVLAVLTFTQVRPDPEPLFQDNTVKDRAIIRARVVMNLPNLVALRDLLEANVRTEQDITQTGGVGSAVRH